MKSPSYAVVFALFAVVAVLVGVATWPHSPVVTVVAAYTGTSFLGVAVAYAGVGPKLLGKRPDGRRSVIATVVILPYFALNAVLFALYRATSREPAHARIVDRLHLGRRLTRAEANSVEFAGVLELAADFTEVGPLRGSPGYRSLPVLDATAPSFDELDAVLDWVAERMAHGPVLVHCALGHGRSATVVIAHLLRVGVVDDVKEGLRLLRSQRPGVHLNRAQREALRNFRASPGGHPDG